MRLNKVRKFRKNICHLLIKKSIVTKITTVIVSLSSAFQISVRKDHSNSKVKILN